MTHFEEMLVTLGANGVENLLDDSSWSFWRATFSTPVTEVEGYYLYLKSRCNLAEANKQNVFKWSQASKSRGYDILLPPKSELSKNLLSTRDRFGGKSARTSKDFLLENFVKKLKQAPFPEVQYFIDPTLILENGTEVQDGADFLLKWISGTAKSCKKTALSVLVAPGGVGKTTISRVLCQKLKEQDSAIAPVLIEAEQWRGLISGSNPLTLNSLWETAISQQIDGANALFTNETAFRVLVREGLLVIVFDGFDELCVNSMAGLRPSEIFEQLRELLAAEDETIEARIILTTRKTYWDQLLDQIDTTQIEQFEIRGFDNDQKKKYFEKRLPDLQERDLALRFSRQVSGGIEDGIHQEGLNFSKPSGWPFILDLIASYVHNNVGDELNPYSYKSDYLGGLLMDVCRRENTRQKLDIEPTKQMELFETLFLEHQEDITKDQLAFYLEVVCNVTDSAIVDKFTQHVFLQLNPNGKFEPKYEVLRVYFVARFLSASFLLADTDAPRARVAMVLAKNSTGKTQVVEWLVTQLRELEPDRLVSAIKHAFVIVSHRDSREYRKSSAMALFDVVRQLIDALGLIDKVGRTEELNKYFAPDSVAGAKVFSGKTFFQQVKGFEFGRTKFVDCDFVDVEFKNCNFDDSTIFERCNFDGQLEFSNCSSQASIHVDNNCKYSREAEYALTQVRSKPPREELRRHFAEEAVGHAVRKFRRKGKFAAIQDQHRKAGANSGNPFNEKVWQELAKHKIVSHHTISNVTGGGLALWEDVEVKREVVNLIDNGVFGPRLESVVRALL